MNSQFVLDQWNKLNKIPFGKKLFSSLLGRLVPYSGSVNPHIEELSKGRALVSIQDKRKVRNHLNSIHAIALVNLAELTSGLALISALPKNARAILVGFEIEYLKKSRGKISGFSEVKDLPEVIVESLDKNIVFELKNTQGEVVAKGIAKWKVGPDKK